MAVSENVSSCSLSAMWDWSHLSLSGAPPAATLLDAASDLLVLERNFAGALELCERGLQILSHDPTDARIAHMKASLCVIGVQALAELERWREVLPWLFQYYLTAQEMPHSIMEMCLLLYSRVKQPHVMLDLCRDWLKDPRNRLLPGYQKVAELHLLRGLLPLGHWSEAEELARDPRAFTPPQQEVALAAVAEERRRLALREEEEAARANQEEPPATGSAHARGGRAAHPLYGALSSVLTWLRRIPLHRLLVALLLMYVVALRLDPASSAARRPLAHVMLLLKMIGGRNPSSNQM